MNFEDVQEKKIVPVFFAFNNDYTVPAAVAFFSLLNSALKNVFYKLYVLHSDITEENQNLLLDILKRFKNNSSLDFIDIKDSFNEFFENGSFCKGEAGSVFTKDTLTRCFASRFFPQYDKIIYSDVDVVFKDDISELYDVDMSETYFAGVRNAFSLWNDKELEHLPENLQKELQNEYIGGGLFVMNLKKIREDKIEEKMFEVINDKTIRKQWPDQDIINLACLHKISFLPLNYISYPYLLDIINNPEFKSVYSKEELFDSIINPKIIHYAANKPWNGEPKRAEEWWNIFYYLDLPKTRIFKKPKTKLRKYKKLFLISLICSGVFLLLVLILFAMLVS